MKLIAQGWGEDEDELVEGICNELLCGDKSYLKIIEDKLFKTDFDYVISRECEYGKDSELADDIKIVAKELYKQLKSEMERK
jgi:hypothetical protein